MRIGRVVKCEDDSIGDTTIQVLAYAQDGLIYHVDDDRYSDDVTFVSDVEGIQITPAEAQVLGDIFAEGRECFWTYNNQTYTLV